MDNQAPEEDVTKALGIGPHHGAGRRLVRPFVAALLAALALAAAAWFWTGSDDSGGYQYITQQAERGDLVVTVTATGRLEPVNQVDVGTEVSGTIETVMVDFNDHVKAGQVLARLDTDALEAQAAQSRAAAKSAEASVVEARSTVVELQKQLEKLQRARELSGGKLPSQHDIDTAVASLARAEAQEETAKARVEEARARLRQNETLLSKAVVRAPISGVVLDRKVEPGQTVAASLQAPVLFTLAETLTQMELSVDVDEADVGQVSVGQGASFTVDAYPERKFEAVIAQVHFAPKTTEGVVTYEALLSVDNADLLLRPGMTATADITVKRIEDALLVPNSALRFSPPKAEEAQDDRGLVDKLIRRWPRRNAERKNGGKGPVEHKVWALEGKRPVEVKVKVGSTDGRMTEVMGGEVRLGQQLVVEAKRLKK